MGFELFVPKMRAVGIGPGQASLDASGNMRLHRSDLGRAGIGKAAALLTDRSNGRVAVRPPKESEPSLSVRPNKSNTAAVLNVGRALDRMGLDPKKVKGRFEVTQKENLLVIQLVNRPAGK